MYCLTKCKSKCVSLITLLLLILISGIPVTEAQKSNALKLTTPKGVRLLKNKSFDDSKQARKEILELYKDLRLTDVLDGMGLIGLQDIGLMDKLGKFTSVTKKAVLKDSNDLAYSPTRR